MSSDAQVLWDRFLDEMREAATAIDRIAAAKSPPPSDLRSLAAAMFDFRCAAALLGIDPAAVAAGYIEELSLGVADGRAWTDVQPAFRQCAAAMEHGLNALRNPDLSGARIEDKSAIVATIEALAALIPSDDHEPAPPASTLPAPPPADDALWIPQVDDDMLDPFLEEAGERVEALSQKLLKLEAAPGDGELVREIFRDLHTIKGSSGFVGLRRMNRLAHAAEDVMGQVRDGKRAVDRPLVDALLGTLDSLRALADAAAQAVASGAPRTAGLRVDVSIDASLARLRGEPASPAPAAAPRTAAGEAPKSEKSSEARTLRVDFDKLDGLLNLVGELVLGKSRLGNDVTSLQALNRELESHLRRARTSHGMLGGEDLPRFQRLFAELGADLGDEANAIDRLVADLRQQVMKLRMLPIGRVFTRFHRTVRELAHQLGKQARLEIEGAETEIDKILLEQLEDPLVHLVRNGLDHGVEMPDIRTAAGKPAEGVLTLSAHHRGNQIVIQLRDDGAGIDPARLRKKAEEKQLATPEELAAMSESDMLDLIFRPGFSTAARVTDISGRGVGMDIVREALGRLSGTIEVTSQPGRGACFTIKLPLTLAILQSLVVRVAGDDFALPLDTVVRSVSARRDQIHRVADRDVLLLGGEQIPIIRISDALELPAPATEEDELPVVLVDAAGEIWGLLAERLGGKREIVLKSLGELLAQVPCVSGATLLGDRVALILDVVQVVQYGLQRRTQRPAPRSVITTAAIAPAAADHASRPRVLVAEDSEVIRETIRRLLEAHGCVVTVARDGTEALALAEREPAFDLVSTDVMMPGLDGYELTRRLRALPQTRDVPIVMVTSRGEHIDRVRGFDAGVDEYLVKPLDSGELVRAIERHIRKRGPA
jgi:chemotaxis protein histidine kinase CheA/CheY-like chemotaxis protein